MSKRTLYWDTVLVVDDGIPEELLEETLHNRPSDFVDGKVDDEPKSTTRYKSKQDIDASRLYNFIQEMNIIPKLTNHKTVWHANYHVFNVKDNMGWHADSKYSIAVTLYLTNCVGGELQVLHDSGTQSILVSPTRNRLVVMKCDQAHRVLDVIEGQRDSIQIFITYVKNGE